MEVPSRIGPFGGSLVLQQMPLEGKTMTNLLLKNNFPVTSSSGCSMPRHDPM